MICRFSNLIGEMEPDTENSKETCSFFVSHKKRNCKMSVTKGKRFCGQHLVNDPCQINGFKRIPCPLDPKHSCYEHKLDHHLKSCNARERTDCPYTKRNLNEGDDVEEPPQILLKDLTDSELLDYITKIESAYKDFVGELQTRYKGHSALKESVSRKDYGPSVIRHLKQNASILNILEEEKLMNSGSPLVFVEFGAGRGQLTHWLIEAVHDKKNSSFVLIDKGAQRYKFDAKLRYIEELNIKRIRIDIQHLNLSKIDELTDDSQIVGCGKHLCGAATDFSLRCLTQKCSAKVVGMVIALCCHHRCTWKSYTGKDFLKTIGLCTKDFPVLISLTSWAVSGSKHPEKSRVISKDTVEFSNSSEVPNIENRYMKMGLSVARREAIGRKMKQILDMGRAYFLRQNGFTANIVEYVSVSSTLENIALVAVSKKAGDSNCDT